MLLGNRRGEIGRIYTNWASPMHLLSCCGFQQQANKHSLNSQSKLPFLNNSEMGVILILYLRYGKWDSEKLNNLSKVMQPVNESAEHGIDPVMNNWKIYSFTHLRCISQQVWIKFLRFQKHSFNPFIIRFILSYYMIKYRIQILIFILWFQVF